MKARATQKKRRCQTSRTAPATVGLPAVALAKEGRCRFTRTDGRRCQMTRTANHATLCLFHAKQEQELAQTDQDLSQELVSLSGNLNTASDVNHVLRKLFSLLAQRRISRRDAAAFAYIAQLILQTLRSVKSEMQIVMGYDAWQETLKAAVGVEEDADTDEPDEAGESDEPDEAEEEDETDESESDLAPSEADSSEGSAELNQSGRPLPQSLAELAKMVLSRHAKSHGAPPPIRGST